MFSTLRLLNGAIAPARSQAPLLSRQCSAILGLLLASCLYPNGSSAQQCVAHEVPDVTPPSDTLPDLSNATLILADNFDSQPDFILPHSGAQCKRVSEADCSLVPDGWTNFYTFEKWHPVDQQDSSLHGSMEISDFQNRGGAGKSLTLWDESWGGSSRWGSDAVLARQFGGEFKDIYAEFYVRYQPGYRWHGLESDGGLNLAKLFRLAHWDGGDTNPFRFFAEGFSAPIVLLDLSVSGKRDIAYLKSAIRCDPQEQNYKCGAYTEGESYSLENSFAGTIGDGAWHKIGIRAKINSAPGVADGIISIWLDDQLFGFENNIPYLGAGADPDHGWNIGMIGGNMHNYPEPESARLEQWHSFDDVKFYSLD